MRNGACIDAVGKGVRGEDKVGERRIDRKGEGRRARERKMKGVEGR